MLAILSIAVGLTIGIASGGSLGALKSHPLKFGFLLLTVFVVQAAARDGAAINRDASVLLWAGCSVVLLVAVGLQVRTRGLGLYWLGSALNAYVVIANNGMPVVLPHAGVPPTSFGSFYLQSGTDTHALALGDVIPSRGGVASIGDVLICVGIAVFLVGAMHRTNKARETYVDPAE